MAKANQHLELKLTNALSTVAVIDHEVVAVVNNINSGILGVLAYIQPSNDKNPRTTLPKSPSYPPPFWKVLFSQNFHIDDHNINTPPATGQPIIISAEVLANLKLVDDKAVC